MSVMASGSFVGQTSPARGLARSGFGGKRTGPRDVMSAGNNAADDAGQAGHVSRNSRIRRTWQRNSFPYRSGHTRPKPKDDITVTGLTERRTGPRKTPAHSREPTCPSLNRGGGRSEGAARQPPRTPSSIVISGVSGESMQFASTVSDAAIRAAGSITSAPDVPLT